MKKIILCSLLMIGVFNKAIGQEKLLTKDDAISLVLEQNFGILIAKNTIDVASNNKSLLNSGYLPTLSGTSNANYNKGDRTTEFPGQFIDDPTTGLKVPVPDNELLGAESRNYGAALNLNYNLLSHFEYLLLLFGKKMNCHCLKLLQTAPHMLFDKSMFKLLSSTLKHEYSDVQSTTGV